MTFTWSKAEIFLIVENDIFRGIKHCPLLKLKLYNLVFSQLHKAFHQQHYRAFPPQHNKTYHDQHNLTYLHQLNLTCPPQHNLTSNNNKTLYLIKIFNRNFPQTVSNLISNHNFNHSPHKLT